MCNIADRESKPERPDRVRERGGALPAVALGLAFVLVSIWIIVGLTGRVVTRSRAQNAADAGALGGAAEGEAVARTLVARNGGVLVSFSQDGNDVSVVVEVDGVRATANAERRLVPGR